MANFQIKDSLKLIIKIAFVIVLIFVAIGFIQAVMDNPKWKRLSNDINRVLYPGYYKRVDFLIAHCQLITGYEDLNDGKTTFKCPDGKEYIEKLP